MWSGSCSLLVVRITSGLSRPPSVWTGLEWRCVAPPGCRDQADRQVEPPAASGGFSWCCLQGLQESRDMVALSPTRDDVTSLWREGGGGSVWFQDILGGLSSVSQFKRETEGREEELQFHGFPESSTCSSLIQSTHSTLLHSEIHGFLYIYIYYIIFYIIIYNI